MLPQRNKYAASRCTKDDHSIADGAKASSSALPVMINRLFVIFSAIQYRITGNAAPSTMFKATAHSATGNPHTEKQRQIYKYNGGDKTIIDGISCKLHTSINCKYFTESRESSSPDQGMRSNSAIKNIIGSSNLFFQYFLIQFNVLIKTILLLKMFQSVFPARFDIFGHS